MGNINEFIANAFWTDYCAEIESSGMEVGSHIKILSTFLEWLGQRVEDGPIVDLRFVRNQAARVESNKIYKGVKNVERDQQ